MAKVRRKTNPEHDCARAWAERFGLPFVRCRRFKRDWPDKLLAQLSYCKNDEARRIILGIRKGKA